MLICCDLVTIRLNSSLSLAHNNTTSNSNTRKKKDGSSANTRQVEGPNSTGRRAQLSLSFVNHSNTSQSVSSCIRNEQIALSPQCVTLPCDTAGAAVWKDVVGWLLTYCCCITEESWLVGGTCKMIKFRIKKNLIPPEKPFSIQQSIFKKYLSCFMNTRTAVPN